MNILICLATVLSVATVISAQGCWWTNCQSVQHQYKCPAGVTETDYDYDSCAHVTRGGRHVNVRCCVGSGDADADSDADSDSDSDSDADAREARDLEKRWSTWDYQCDNDAQCQQRGHSYCSFASGEPRGWCQAGK